MTEHFFPTVPARTLQLEVKLRRTVKALPEASRLAVYEVFSEAHPGLTPTRFRLEEQMVVAIQAGREIAFPRPLPMVKHLHVVCGYETWLAHKYALPGFVGVEPGDVVIDCGAYVGGFSLNAARVARSVHLFEPDLANFACIQRNFQGAGNVLPHNMGLYDESCTMVLNISESSVEHSFLTPDDGSRVTTREVDVITLADYCRDRGIGTPDFVKIEAEGVELEVFDGLGGLRPAKFAVDVSPEREGQSPAEAFRERFERLGYEVRQRAHVMFARLSG